MREVVPIEFEVVMELEVVVEVAAGVERTKPEDGLGTFEAPTRAGEVHPILDEVAAGHKATAGQVAIAWQMARPAITAPIASATSLNQMAELVAAAQLVLSAADIALLNEASA